MTAFEHYINVKGRKLRLGYTTGTCAVLAAKGAVYALLKGSCPSSLSVMTPKGIPVESEPYEAFAEADRGVCGIKKDGGDDRDVTDGLIIYALAVRIRDKDVVIKGGKGIGKVTKPGLDRPVGDAAINSVPRREIRSNVLKIMEEEGYDGGIEITIYAPKGEEAAKKTFNEKLGVVGGISIIGSSGIVEPMSLKAYSDAVRLEIRQKAALGHRKLIFVLGNYGLDHLKDEGIGDGNIPVIVISNFIGDAIDEAAADGIEGILIVGHAGKLVKTAAGIMDTHSSNADGRVEVFAAHAALMGGDKELIKKIMESVTTDACIELIKEAGIYDETMQSIINAAYRRISERAGSGIKAGIIMFSEKYGRLGKAGEIDL